MQNNIISSVTTGTDFWAAVKIYFEHPNSINKQTLFSETLLAVKVEPNANIFMLSDDLSWKLEQDNIQKVMENFELEEIKDVVSAFEESELENFLLVRRLIPKLFDDPRMEFYEYLFIDKPANTVYIFTKHVKRKTACQDNVTPKQDPYIILKFTQIKLNYCDNTLQIIYDPNLGEKGINWLKSIFIKKFSKLMTNASDNKSRQKNLNKLNFTSKVNVVEYYQFYDKMKSKYAQYLIDNWTENTDPKKFVYEDIGIASYLMMLWNDGTIPGPDAKKQKFVDLGCGNGLLVHILNSEGHMGVGLDIRKRKIWEKYPSTTVLQERTINPTTSTIYPDADWLIGNHSDELTAWIPIMARRSNDHCHYFVLPCCPFQLNGKKFQRKNCALSSYQDFVNYVKDVSDLCYFETYLDRLRIPSTKRICLIGTNKPDMTKEKIELVNNDIARLIRQECQTSESGKDSATCNDDLSFKVRESVESVKNCTKLPQTFIDDILRKIVHELIKKSCVCVTADNRTWNKGGRITISNLAEAIDETYLAQLKKECKGLQTLLKNHHFLFEVGQGYVQLRSPESMLSISKKFLANGDQSKWKKRKCWFFNNHPDKCPLPNDVCSYSHEISE